ncbi:MAG: hypothetical protein CMJ58_23905 [Planctomycetaceae bacterium]|nr:hypothetical protein [Planctomycetaceae bacterium]
MRSAPRLLAFALSIFVLNSQHAARGQVNVIGGQTSVLLDTDTLSTAASLDLSSVSADVIAPGSLGAASVAFGITPRSAATLPTDFSYAPNNFPAGGSFAGKIEHQGSVFFNADAVEVGDFTIGFDGARVGTLGGAASGFFVESNAGIAAILFDISVTSLPSPPSETSLEIAADLLVSPEFGQFLFDNSLSTTNLAGADVGDALVEAIAIPEPGAWCLAAIGAVALAWRRGRRL